MSGTALDQIHAHHGEQSQPEEESHNQASEADVRQRQHE